MSFSFSLIRRVRRCGPAITRSMASSRVTLVIISWLPRAVRRAASLSTLARSAPLKPGVRRATESRFTSWASGFPRGCTRRICSRPGGGGGGARALPVEAARAQQRRGEHVGPVGRRDQDHAAAHVEAVHLDQQLVEGLLALVV